MQGLIFLVMILGASVSSFVAAAKNRNPVGWFFAGLLLPLIALMILAVSPALPPPWERAAADRKAA
jgi:uncharacterized membrane protein YfcA